MNQAVPATAWDAARGIMPGAHQPACAQYMYQWEAQAALLSTEIQQLQGAHGSVCQLSGYCAPSSSYSPSSSSGGSYNNPDGGVNAAERTSRIGIQGNCNYSDQYGEVYSRPCENYYYQDTRSGELSPTDRPEVPNNGRDYQLLNSDDGQ